MNTQTRDRIIRHGQALLAAFPNAVERDPLALCKKLRRIETVAHRFATDYCNGDVSSDDEGEKFYRQHGRGTSGPFLTEAIDGPEVFLARVCKILSITPDKAKETGLFVNLDARGYALKLSDEWTRQHNATADLRLHSDWGGYGIIAPDLTESN
jgi:hypothetical protein